MDEARTEDRFRRRGQGFAVVACAGLLLLFAVLAWSAQSGKGFTFDEPLHGLGAWTNLRQGDYRVGFELPPLWKYWAALPNDSRALETGLYEDLWRTMPDQPARRWEWANGVLYRMPGNDPDAFLRRERAMMLVVAVLLGAAIGWAAWQVAGPAAAVFATALYALDPTFLGHGPLVKNDVAISLLLLLQTILVWRLLRRVTPLGVVLLGLLWGAGMTVKFSAAVFAMAAVLTLLIRAAGFGRWPVGGRDVVRIPARLATAAGVACSAALIAYGVIWAVYGFRFSATNPPAAGPLNMDYEVATVRERTLATAAGDAPVSAAARAAWTAPASVRLVLWLDRHRLLPEAMLAGLLNTMATAAGLPAYLFGRYSFDGWWYYFPAAALVKTPLATFAALAFAAGWGVWRVRAWLRAPSVARRPGISPDAFAVLSFAVAFGVYAVVAMSSKLDVGLRYVFPLYPLAFVGIGAALAGAWRTRRRWGRALPLLVILGLATETLAAYPDYIAFFNAAAGGERGGLALLSDSNLDWGQDLPLLAAWLHDHPDHGTVYLGYFGREDPYYYGIRYAELPGGFLFGPPPRFPSEPGILAVGATLLQSQYQPPEIRRFYAQVRASKPLAVLGGTIYIYRWPLPVQTPLEGAPG